jgi:group II intron reverse transcriptase/maturase
MNKKQQKDSKKNSKQNIIEGIEFIERLGRDLGGHTRRNEDTSHINYKIHHLLHDPFTFVNAYAKISKNKGALTKGVDDDNVIQLFGLEKATNIAKKIKKGTYTFKPVQRTWIPKPGKNKKRPIDVPNQSDRIVQEAVRGILEAIYEPVFQEFGEKTKNLCNNYGFRPKKSCWSAVEKLKLHSKKCNIAIEGDIVSAYNNVDHDILLKILSRRIKDKKFLKLIKDMLKSGIMDQRRFEHSLNGTPQGGIVSPLLFNIYMYEFDKYVYEQCIKPILNENEEQEKKPEVRSRKYNQISYKTKKARIEYVELRDKYRTKSGDININQVKKAKKQFKKLQLELLATPYNESNRVTKGVVYVRYADDWVLTLTCSIEEAKKIKTKISQFLEIHLKMQLDEDKTAITPTSKGYKFLGFEIRRNVGKPKLARVLQKVRSKGKTIHIRPLRRTTSLQITIEPDSDRILKRLTLLKMCDKKYFPKGKTSWTIYNEFQIVQKYALMMRGIFNYYKPCNRLSRLYHISYILQYSCAKTIAIRKKMSLPQVLKRYGLNLRISATIQNTKNESKTKWQQFYDIIALRKMEAKNQDFTYRQMILIRSEFGNFGELSLKFTMSAVFVGLWITFNYTT